MHETRFQYMLSRGENTKLLGERVKKRVKRGAIDDEIDLCTKGGEIRAKGKQETGGRMMYAFGHWARTVGRGSDRGYMRLRRNIQRERKRNGEGRGTTNDGCGTILSTSDGHADGE